MSYQRFSKGGRVAKSPVFRKKCARKLNKTNKNGLFSGKTTFFELPITQKRFIFEDIVTFQMVNVKRVVL